MSIPSHLPQIVTAARSGALQALALQAGQTLVGTVMGPAPNGGTQVQISGQMLNLILPSLAKAGETLKFEVQGSGTQLRLALQPATAPIVATSAPNPAPRPRQTAPLPLPQTAVPTPAQTGAQPTATTPTPAALQVVVAPTTAPPPAPAASAPIPAQSGMPQPAAPPVSAQPGSATPVPAASAPPSISVAPSVPNGAAPPSLPANGGSPAQVQPYGQTHSAAAPRQAVVPGPTNVAGRAAAMATSTMSTPTAPPTPAPPASTPQAALAQMVQASVPRQAPVTNLTNALASIAGKVVLPEPVARAAQQVMGNRLNVAGGKIDAVSLQKAVLNSGVFQEATLARGTAPQQPDMKSSLLALRQTLTNWLGQQAPIAALSQVAPPLRGGIPRVKGLDAPPIDPAAPPEEVGKRLLERTDAALSRVRLHQSASLPDGIAKGGADWSMDLPVLIGSHQTLMQLQIHRDQQGNAEDQTERGWQMRFAINLPGMGEVGAQVSLRGTATGVMLWASDRAASEALEAEVVALREALSEAGLKPGAVIVRHGEPATPSPAPSGHFVDSRT